MAQFNSSLNTPYLIEYKQDFQNDSGYRIWFKRYSDGTLEQGGALKIGAFMGNMTFLTPFKDTDYSSLDALNFQSTSENGIFVGITGTKQTTNCNLGIIGRTGQTGVAYYGGWVDFLFVGRWK